MKWDYITGNPPFSKNLHLKIISAVLPSLSDEGTATFIHPARWLLDPLAEYKNGADKVKFKNIVDRLDDVKVIDTKTSNTQFRIDFPSGELMISKMKSYPTDKHISVFNELANECIDVILNYSLDHNLSQMDEEQKVDGWRCQIKGVVPAKNGRCQSVYWRTRHIDIVPAVAVFENGIDKEGVDWIQVRQRGKFVKEPGTPFPHSIKFESEQEALNFQKSCRTNFYRNIVFLLKMDMQTPLKFLPWMEDYSHPWTDKDYCEFFGKLGMSEECQKWMCREVYDYRVKDFVEYEKF